MNTSKKCEVCGKLNSEGRTICQKCSKSLLEMINAISAAKEFAEKNPDKLKEIQDKFR